MPWIKLPPRAKDVTGQSLGRLTALGPVSILQQAGGARVVWRFRCECGQEVDLVPKEVFRRDGRGWQSCGCLRRETTSRIGQANRIHGHGSPKGRSSTYFTWEAMMKRCYNQITPEWKYYGALGVTVCDRWHRFQNFLNDMGDRPLGKTIDRYPDKNGNYEPSNCRWATPRQQMRNRRDNIYITAFGRTALLVEFTGGSKTPEYSLALNRLKRGWSMERAVTFQKGGAS